MGFKGRGAGLGGQSKRFESRRLWSATLRAQCMGLLRRMVRTFAAHRGKTGVVVGPAKTVASDGKLESACLKLLHFPPPGGLLDAHEVSLFAARKIEIKDIVLMECAAVGPTRVFLQRGWAIVHIFQGDVVQRALNDAL